ESALEDLVKPEEIESVAILGGTGATIASAGNKMELTPEMLQSKGVFWRGDTVTIINLADVDAPANEDSPRTRPPIVVSDESARALRPPSNRRATESRSNTAASNPAAVIPSGAEAESAPATSAAQPPPTTASSPRFAFGRPPWIPPEDFDALIRKQGMQ